MTGVKNREILLAHILSQSTLVIIHVTLIMILFFPIWDLDCEGSYALVFFIMFLCGLTGLMYGRYTISRKKCKQSRKTVINKILISDRHNTFSGFFISVACKDHTMANYASTGSFFPLVIISGKAPCFLHFNNYLLFLFIISIVLKFPETTCFIFSYILYIYMMIYIILLIVHKKKNNEVYQGKSNIDIYIKFL